MPSFGHPARLAALEDRGVRVLVDVQSGEVRSTAGDVLATAVAGQSGGGGPLVLLDRSPMSIRLAFEDGRVARRVEVELNAVHIETEGESRTVHLPEA